VLRYSSTMLLDGAIPGRATAGVLLQLILDYTAFTLILILGLIYLYTSHNLQLYEIIGLRSCWL